MKGYETYYRTTKEASPLHQVPPLKSCTINLMVQKGEQNKTIRLSLCLWVSFPSPLWQ